MVWIDWYSSHRCAISEPEDLHFLWPLKLILTLISVEVKLHQRKHFSSDIIHVQISFTDKYHFSVLETNFSNAKVNTKFSD